MSQRWGSGRTGMIPLESRPSRPRLVTVGVQGVVASAVSCEGGDFAPVLSCPSTVSTDSTVHAAMHRDPAPPPARSHTSRMTHAPHPPPWAESPAKLATPFPRRLQTYRTRKTDPDQAARVPINKTDSSGATTEGGAGSARPYAGVRGMGYRWKKWESTDPDQLPLPLWVFFQGGARLTGEPKSLWQLDVQS